MLKNITVIIIDNTIVFMSQPATIHSSKLGLVLSVIAHPISKDSPDIISSIKINTPVLVTKFFIEYPPKYSD